MQTLKPSPDDLARVYRAESGRLTAVLMSQYRDIDLAQDALQDACVQASEQWPQQGMPKHPAAWLLNVARRRLIDRLRKSSHAGKESVIQNIHHSLRQSVEISEADQAIPDERLKLIFTCCHPALSERARVGLTLRVLCGLSTREIARAYLVSEATLQQRLSRAKRKIRDAGIAYTIPEADELEMRLPSVLEVIYLIYNESYTAYEGQTLSREDLANEAIRLARILNTLLSRPQVAGLLALMLLHQARAKARTSIKQSYIPLQQQDRNLWDQGAISEGRSLLLAAMAQGHPDKYQIQAAISALHSEAARWEDTDWHQIGLLYNALNQLEPSPVVELNRAVAIAHSGDLNDAQSKLEKLANALSKYQPYHAACADTYAKSGLLDLAQESYRRAIALSNNNPERDFLIGQLNGVLKVDHATKKPS